MFMLPCRHNFDTQLAQWNFKSNDDLNHVQDLDAMELSSRARAQEAEILSLREQIAVACVKQELQLLNEKCKLERKFSELRMAIDEKQNEAITSASNEMARRKGDLEENLKLAHDLKAAEDERYIFMSSMLGLLAEYSLWPRVMNASAISNSIKLWHNSTLQCSRELHAVILEGARSAEEVRFSVRVSTLLWAATGGSAAAGPHRRDRRRRCLPLVPLPVVSDVGGSPESLRGRRRPLIRVHGGTPEFDGRFSSVRFCFSGHSPFRGCFCSSLLGFTVAVWSKREWIGGCWRFTGGSSRQDKPSSWVSEKVSYADIVKNLEGGVGRRDDNGSEGRSCNGIRESLAPQNKFKKTLKIHLDPNGRRRVEWVLERRVQQPRSPLRLALSKGPPDIHKSLQQPKKRVNWALHDTTQKNGTKRANESRVEELGQVKAQSSLNKVAKGSDGVRNEAIRPLALMWVAKGVDKAKKGTEVMGSVLGAVSGEGSDYNSSTHASSKGKEVIQEVDLGPSCSGTKGEMTSHSFFDAEALSSDTSDTETVDDDSLISHFENEEGLLIEQLEREFVEEQKQQNKEAEVPLDGFAVLFGGEGEEATHVTDFRN
ncbi:hypothetical protein G2W53_001554 [Senna tora]|uniref:Uncharacterized protein n=1 Tax=Senna tora TaxID=362788 RepID=A0A835CJJ6_9FABA|nr:hypothetical protein G2W53_001554 [Senna tora]